MVFLLFCSLFGSSRSWCEGDWLGTGRELGGPQTWANDGSRWETPKSGAAGDRLIRNRPGTSGGGGRASPPDMGYGCCAGSRLETPKSGAAGGRGTSVTARASACFTFWQ